MKDDLVVLATITDKTIMKIISITFKISTM